MGARPRRAARHRRRDGGMGERRGGGRVEQGDEAEEGPSHKGAMRARGEAPVEVQGVQRLSAREAARSFTSVCKECGGGSICEHGRRRSTESASGRQSVQGVRWVSNLRARSSPRRVCSCKECGGAGNLRARSSAPSVLQECGGGAICEHGRQRLRARSAAGPQICEHGRRRSQCKECGGSGICEHGRQRSKCKECGGGSICEHDRASGGGS